ncbi:MAG TPA: phage minor tail protein L [Burkholderiales bacterium]
MTLARDLQRLEVSNLITMMELDPTALGGSIQRFHNDSTFAGANIVWQGATYTRFPVDAKGFEFSARGKMPRPTITVANVLGSAGLLLRQYNDLIGAVFTRKRTLAKYLDLVNWISDQGTAQAGGASSLTLRAGASAQNDLYIGHTLAITGGTGSGQSKTITAYDGATKIATVDSAWGVAPDGTSVYEARHPAYATAAPDPSVYLPDDIYVIDRKAAETKLAVTWELSSAFDVQGVQVPRRQIIQNTCAWIYKSAECGYVPGAMFKIDDSPTAVAGEDVCGHRLSSCKARFGATAELPYGGFPGAGLT